MFQGMGGHMAFAKMLEEAARNLAQLHRANQQNFWQRDWKKERRRAWKRRRSSGLYR